MRTSRKIIASVLAACMLVSAGTVASFAASADGSVGADTDYSRACEAIDAEYTYDGELGAIYSKSSTTFKMWSPTATEVTLNRYATGSDDEKNAAKLGTVAMEKLMDGDKWTGVWTATVSGDLVNTYYTYSVTAAHPKSGKVETAETQDVYSVATGVNGKRSMVCDLSATNPEGWNKDTHVLLDKSTDSYVWELHVKDFSYDPASGVSEANRGKYLAFTETGTTLDNEGKIATCVDYLKELGVTTVQLNPFYDFQSINEAGSDKQFNWGYDPQNYNVPEGSYSSNPYDGNVRIKECKAMIQALHNAGIAVVMDVVYNHTYSCDKDSSCFQASVPDYYYRLSQDGTFSNGSGCGNEVSTERAMTRKYIIESVLHWVNEYHVDGFRFDLMGLMDVETMNAIRSELDKVDSRITTWGEGWTGGSSTTPSKTCTGASFKQATQANAKYLNERVAFFNDKIRDGIKGSVFNINDKGFIAGNIENAKHIRHGVRANSVSTNGWLAQSPAQCVTYADCHDNATIYDQIVASCALGEYGEKSDRAVAMNKLAAAIEFTSQGILFNLAGQEFARTKLGDTNSYKSAPEINQITWANVRDYAELVSYYKGLRMIRQNFAPFTAADKSYQNAYIFDQNLSQSTSTVSFTVENNTAGQWKKMAVLYNGINKTVTIPLKDTSVTSWVVIADDEQAGVTKIKEVNGTRFSVPANSAVIAVDKESFESTAIESNMGKVVVDYVYKYTGEKLASSAVLQGEIGTGYVTSPSVGVKNTYVLDSVEGAVSGTYSEEPQKVTYSYVDYVPENLAKYGDINGDGTVDISDVTEFQRFLVDLITVEHPENLDFNYDGRVDITDCTMLQKYLVGVVVSSGEVNINYFYLDENGEKQNLVNPIHIEGRVGDSFTSEEYKVIGYVVDETKYPAVTSGQIPYGSALNVDYWYKAGSMDVTVHVKHMDSTGTWNPSLWIWGAGLDGKDNGENYSPDNKASWPGVTLTEQDADGWFDYSFTCRGAGSYNIIVSKGGNPQSMDYKGF
ncbi:MAG: type I pullulanase, partial [Ruminococcus sp.]|nr:type I pullulanase [Ruminococcus sp.]